MAFDTYFSIMEPTGQQAPAPGQSQSQPASQQGYGQPQPGYGPPPPQQSDGQPTPMGNYFVNGFVILILRYASFHILKSLCLKFHSSSYTYHILF